MNNTSLKILPPGSETQDQSGDFILTVKEISLINGLHYADWVLLVSFWG